MLRKNAGILMMLFAFPNESRLCPKESKYHCIFSNLLVSAAGGACKRGGAQTLQLVVRSVQPHHHVLALDEH